MKKFIVLIGFILLASSCKSSKHVSYSSETQHSNTAITSKDIPVSENYESVISNPVEETEVKALNIDLVDYAIQFEGVRYKSGGTTNHGMDCSGLVYETFRAYNIDLPRVSRDMANVGEKIKLDDVKPGDLLFFHTNPKRKTINHVGLVVSARTGHVEFIHSTTSRGVITSSLAEHYWYYSFTEARRIL